MNKDLSAFIAATLDEARKIPVPEPGTGEIVTIPLELLSAWMKLNNRKVVRWQGSILVTAPDSKKQMEKKDGSK